MGWTNVYGGNCHREYPSLLLVGLMRPPTLKTRLAVAEGLVRDDVSSGLMSTADLHTHLKWVAEFVFNSTDQEGEFKALLYMVDLAIDLARRLSRY